MEELGYIKGDVCNRNGCNGVIEEHDSGGGCSCHISPPCGHCTEDRAYCDTCNWDAKEERAEYDKKMSEVNKANEVGWAKQRKEWSDARELFFKKYRGEIEPDKLELRTESHTHFSQKVLGIHPEGFNLSEHMDKIRGTFGGRFNRVGKTSFEYIAYTD